MATTQAVIDAPPSDIFTVLADGWQYASWVVGASHIRAVDEGWPAPGTRTHHSVGLWPLAIADSTVAEEMEPNRYLALRARAWPLGEARVRLVLKPLADSRTEVLLDEVVIAGPGRVFPDKLIAPLIRARNREALRRLGHIATRHAELR